MERLQRLRRDWDDSRLASLSEDTPDYLAYSLRQPRTISYHLSVGDGSSVLARRKLSDLDMWLRLEGYRARKGGETSGVAS